jgi:ferredoxin-NADP reductase
MLSRSEILLQVADIKVLTARVSAYRLISPYGDRLPAWSAGAHLNFRLPSGRSRCYSLCGDPGSTAEYWIAVQREEQGEGGSLEVAKAFARGVVVRADRPRNGFALAQEARHHLLLAGGIGITPIIAMIHHLRRAKASYVGLHLNVRMRRFVQVAALNYETLCRANLNFAARMRLDMWSRG